MRLWIPPQLLFVLICASTLSHADPLAQSYSIEQLLSDMENNNATTIEEVIPLLPLDLRSNYTLIYQGHGLRETSFEKPAALLFGGTGRFIITFNSPDQRTGQDLEIMQFNDSQSRLELYKLTFPVPRGTDGHLQRPAANPAECTKCHGTDPRALWGSYQTSIGERTWNGVYGGMDDNLDADEIAGFDLFRRYTMSAPRFGALVRDPQIWEYPYTRVPKGDLLLRPNTRFTALVARLDARKVARAITESPRFEKYKYLLLFSLSDCGGLKNGIFRSTITGKDYKHIQSVIHSDLDYPADSHLEVEHRNTILYLLGIKSTDWFPSLESSGYPAYYDGTSYYGRDSLSLLIIAPVFDKILADHPDPELAETLTGIGLTRLEPPSAGGDAYTSGHPKAHEHYNQMADSIATYGGIRSKGCSLLRKRIKEQIQSGQI